METISTVPARKRRSNFGSSINRSLTDVRLPAYMRKSRWCLSHGFGASRMTRSTKAGKLFDIANWSDRAKATIYIGEIQHRSDIAAPPDISDFGGC
jgi:hypothetical protein